MNDRELMQQALDAFEYHVETAEVEDKRIEAAIYALRTVLHQQTIDALRGKVEKLKPKHPWIGLMDEPVAWMFQHEETGRTMCVDAQQLESGFEDGNPRLKKIAPLYTNPRPWVGLTDEDRKELAAEQHGWEGLCSAVEAKLRERNT